jgi:hypothetical protein
MSFNTPIIRRNIKIVFDAIFFTEIFNITNPCCGFERNYVTRALYCSENIVKIITQYRKLERDYYIHCVVLQN